jgi:hypothetical protein
VRDTDGNKIGISQQDQEIHANPFHAQENPVYMQGTTGA